MNIRQLVNSKHKNAGGYSEKKVSFFESSVIRARRKFNV